MLFGVMDLARTPAGVIETALAIHSPDAVCLYRDPLKEGIRRCAPYLAPLPPGSPFAQFWQDYGWGSAWGVIVRTDQTLEGLRRHLRRFLTVLLPDGDRALLRFYDPRVLPAYLRSCNREELAAWFAGVTAFRVEAPPPKQHVEFSFDGLRLIET